jgi:drug/metabolite transporter (DMT)-like permease
MRGRMEIALWMVVVIWGANYPITKFGLQEIPPVIFTALRFLVAAPVMLTVLRWREGALDFSREDFSRLLLLGLVSVSVYQILFNAALKYTTAGNVALALGISPIFTALFGALSGQERLRPLFLAGSVIASIGLGMVIGTDNPSLAQYPEASFGNLLAGIAAALWGLYPIMAKPLLRHHSSLWVTTHTTLLGTVALIIIVIPELGTMQWQHISVTAWGAVLYSGIMATVVAFIIWYRGIDKLGASRTMIYMYMVAPTAMLVAAFTIGEVPRPVQMIGAVVAILGVALARKGAGKTEKKQTY